MSTIPASYDPWLEITRQLRGLSVVQPSPKARKSIAPSTRNTWISQKPARVTARPTALTVNVTWCDSTSGYLGDQTWRLCFAREAGICVLSGEPIKRGDPVFRPRQLLSEPVNAKAMILEARISIPFQANAETP